MGDRYELDLHCAYCNELNYDIWYAPTCDMFSYICSNCGKENFIKGFQSVRKEDMTVSDLYDEFMSATIVGWSEDECKDIFKNCKRILK